MHVCLFVLIARFHELSILYISQVRRNLLLFIVSGELQYTSPTGNHKCLLLVFVKITFGSLYKSVYCSTMRWWFKQKDVKIGLHSSLANCQQYRDSMGC